MTTLTAPDGRVGIPCSSTHTHVCLRFADGTAQWFTRGEVLGAPAAPSKPRPAVTVSKIFAAALGGLLALSCVARMADAPPAEAAADDSWTRVYTAVHAQCRESALSATECAALERRARRAWRESQP